ncbi:uncharacterized protein LOC115326712 [Ixodes scapularis]|uniref:uncharacterized protein LOC115326712 n=1 Tax=Ixodes scapularis TaxID=6945 RepID=UPI001C393F64|nr:uncharacterized protein LOC115326712 [Ixodes scapularis]
MRALQAAYFFLADSTGRCVPHHDVGEGTDNCADHVEIMAAECSKAAPDVKLLLQMMAQTSQARRVDIAGKTTTDVIQLHPALCIPEVLQQELDLLKDTSSISSVQAKIKQGLTVAILKN